MMSKLDMKILNTTTVSPKEQVLTVNWGGGEEEQITITCDQIDSSHTPSGIFDIYQEKAWQTAQFVRVGDAKDYENTYINIHFSKAKPIQKMTFIGIESDEYHFSKINILTSMDSVSYNSIGNYRFYDNKKPIHDHAVDIHYISDVKFYIYNIGSSYLYGTQRRQYCIMYQLQFYVSDYIPYISYESDKLFSYK